MKHTKNFWIAIGMSVCIVTGNLGLTYADEYKTDRSYITEITDTVSGNNEGLVSFDVSEGNAEEPIANPPAEDPTEECGIFYDLDGGTANNPTKIAKGESFTLQPPVKEGYVFAGWIGSNGVSPEQDVNVTYQENGLTYIAIWTTEAVSGNDLITYGTGVTSSITYNLDGGEADNPDTVEEGVPFILANPTREGYRFLGWTGSCGDTPLLQVEVSYTGADLSYTANWEVAYKITIDYRGGTVAWSGKDNPADYTSSDEDITLIAPAKVGEFIFVGWTGTGIPSIAPEVTIPHGSTGDKKYYAVYKNVTVSNSQTGKYNCRVMSQGTGSDAPGIDDYGYHKGTNEYLGNYIISPQIAGYTIKNVTVTDSSGNSLESVMEDADPFHGENAKIVRFKFDPKDYCNLYGSVNFTLKVETESGIPDWDYTTTVDSSNYRTVSMVEYVGDVPGADVVLKSHYVLQNDDYSTLFESTSGFSTPGNPFIQHGANIKTFTVEATDGRMIKTTKCDSMFQATSSSKYNSSTGRYETTYYGCQNIQTIDLSGMDLTEVETISSMFTGCSTLEKIIWGPINTSKITSLYHVFSDCSLIEDFDFLKDWEIKNITNLSCTFNNCKKLKHLPIENWDVSKVLYAYCFASNCKALEDIDFINSWNFNSLVGMDNEWMFSDCDSLTDVNVTFHLENNTSQYIRTRKYSFARMFEYCDNLENASVTFLLPDGAKPLNINSIFQRCQKLKTVKIKSTSGISEPSYWFNMDDLQWESNALEKVTFDVPLSDYNGQYDNNIYSLFRNTNKIKSLDLSFLRADNITTFSDNFKDNTALEYLNISNISFAKLYENDTNRNVFKDLASLAKFDTPKAKASFDIPLPHTMVDLDGNEYDVIPATSKTLYTPYYLTYDLDGGTITNPNPANYTYDTPDFTLNAPVKENSKFLGWTEDNGVTVEKNVTIKKGSASHRSFKAVWADSYEIKKDISGKGTVKVSDRAYAQDVVPISFIPASGYEFTSATITDAAGNKLEYTDSFVMPAASVTIKATFTKKKSSPVNPPSPDVPSPGKTPFRIAKNISGQGTLTVAAEAFAKDTVYLQAEASNGYRLKSLKAYTITGEEIPLADYFSMPESDVSIYAVFEKLSSPTPVPVTPTPEEPKPTEPIPNEPVPEEPLPPTDEPETGVSDDLSSNDITPEINDAPEKRGRCYIHFIILVCMVLYILLTMVTRKKSWKYRTVVFGINILTVLLLLLLGKCWIDIPAVIINFIVTIGFFITKNYLDTDDEEMEEDNP